MVNQTQNGNLAQHWTQIATQTKEATQREDMESCFQWEGNESRWAFVQTASFEWMCNFGRVDEQQKLNYKTVYKHKNVRVKDGQQTGNRMNLKPQETWKQTNISVMAKTNVNSKYAWAEKQKLTWTENRAQNT